MLAYSVEWINNGGGAEFTFHTSDVLDPGQNIFTSIALSRVRFGQDGNIIAGIYSWTVYDEDGGFTTQGGGPEWTGRNCLFIDNCRTITYVLFVGFGTVAAPAIGTVQISIENV